ncbi:MAG TPA: hypothetical protein VFH95_15765 [Candidatus Kapabacteria bacterium]|nr:hypothetical protein [Candidatus Kapabacteria bacterium]
MIQNEFISPFNLIPEVRTPLFSNNSIQKKISSFAELKKGWHFGEGVGPTNKIIRDALALHREILMRGFSKTGAFPGVGGEIRLTIYDYNGENNEYHEFTFESNGTLTYVHEAEGKEDVELPDLDLDNVRKILAELKTSKFEWFSSELSQENSTWISTINRQNFKTWPSKRPMAESPFSLKIVQSNEATQYVIISGGSMVVKPRSHRASSAFQNPLSRLAHVSSLK